MGLDYIQLSLDGATSESHDWLRNKQGTYEKVLRAIAQLNEFKTKYKSNLKISVVFCLSKKNYNELKDVIDLCIQLNVDILRIQPLMLIGRANSELSEYSLSAKEYTKASDYLVKKRYENIRSSSLTIEWCDSLEHLFIDQLDFVQVNEKGELLLSPYIPIIVGDLKQHSIIEYLKKNYSELWNHKLIRLFRKNMNSTNNMGFGNIFSIEVGFQYMRFGKRKIVSTLTFLGGCFAATYI